MRSSLDVAVEVEIDRPVAEVWSFVTDMERMPEWIGEFTDAHHEADRPQGLGTVVHYTVGGGRSGTFEIIEWDPPQKVAWDGPPLPWMGGGGRPRGSHELTAPSPTRTRLRSRYQPELTGTLVLMRPYLERWLRRQRRSDAQTLKRLLEAS